jgi:acylglycerol lipase
VTHREDSFAGAGGRRIFWQCWLPDSAPRAVVLVAHGAGEHSSRYAHVADRLVSEGHAVYALDHRGHGRSEGPRAQIERMDSVVADLDSLVVLTRGEHDAVPIFLLGHSMGGAISVSYTMRHQDRLRGLILSGPLAALDAASPPVRLIATVLSALTPGLGLMQVDASLVSRDPEVVRAYTEDPLVHHGKLPVRTIAELAKAIDGFPDGVGAITIPSLILYGTADQLCPPAGSQMLEQRIGASDKTLRSYEGLYHEILNEPEQVQVLDDICAWIDARI